MKLQEILFIAGLFRVSLFIEGGGAEDLGKRPGGQSANLFTSDVTGPYFSVFCFGKRKTSSQ